MFKKIFFTFFFCFVFVQNSYALREDFNFIILDVPLGWKVVEKKDNELTLTNLDQSAQFIYKIMPVYAVTLKQYAEAIMRAYGGYRLREEKKGIFSFDFIANQIPATTTVQFCKENMACIQTAVGQSDDFVDLFNAGELK